MNFYIASSLKNKRQVQQVASKLILHGHTHTYDWTTNSQLYSVEQLAEIGTNEIEGVKAADVVIVLLPAGKGSHVEMGIGIALGKTVILYSDTSDHNDLIATSTFYHVPEVDQVIGTIEDLLTSVNNLPFCEDPNS